MVDHPTYDASLKRCGCIDRYEHPSPSKFQCTGIVLAHMADFHEEGTHELKKQGCKPESPWISKSTIINIDLYIYIFVLRGELLQRQAHIESEDLKSLDVASTTWNDAISRFFKQWIAVDNGGCLVV